MAEPAKRDGRQQARGAPTHCSNAQKNQRRGPAARHREIQGPLPAWLHRACRHPGCPRLPLSSGASALHPAHCKLSSIQQAHCKLSCLAPTCGGSSQSLTAQCSTQPGRGLSIETSMLYVTPASPWLRLTCNSGWFAVRRAWVEVGDGVAPRSLGCRHVSIALLETSSACMHGRAAACQSACCSAATGGLSAPRRLPNPGAPHAS